MKKTTRRKTNVNDKPRTGGKGGRKTPSSRATGTGKKPPRIAKRAAKPGVRKSSVRAKQRVSTTAVGGQALTPGRAFPELRKCDGLGSMIAVGEQVGGKWHMGVETVQIPTIAERGSGAKTPSRRSARAVGGQRRLHAITAPLAALGHAKRLDLMLTLLEGSGTYGDLQKATGLKPGPLYHHVSQLRLAGLILPKQRDLYELTRAGRNLMLVALALEPLLRDSRPRP